MEQKRHQCPAHQDDCHACGARGHWRSIVSQRTQIENMMGLSVAELHKKDRPTELALATNLRRRMQSMVKMTTIPASIYRGDHERQTCRSYVFQANEMLDMRHVSYSTHNVLNYRMTIIIEIENLHGSRGNHPATYAHSWWLLC